MSGKLLTYTVMPDFGGAYGWTVHGDERGQGVGGCHADCSGWYGDHAISPELQNEFAQWQRTFESGGLLDHPNDGLFDWPAFHARGIDLTRRLKAELGDSVRIVYEKPMEDPNYRNEERREVLNGGTLLLLENRAQILRSPFRHLVDRIVSGGQTGVDRAALDWAIELGVEHGGWCPKGRKAEDGVIDSRYCLRELGSAAYRARTRQNVVDSDGTLILNLGELSEGTLETRGFAERFGKPHLVVPLDQGANDENVESVLNWLRIQPIRTLNIAGPRESKRPGIYRTARDFLARIESSGSPLNS